MDKPVEFRLFRPSQPAVALGLAVNHLMTKPAFANLRFGSWSRVLVGQINRGHYCFVVDADKKIVGFAGWALTTREKAEAWVNDSIDLGYEDSRAGECLLFNAWSSDTNRVQRFMVGELRRLVKDSQTIYFKRYYPDGSRRPGRVNVNDFVVEHIARRDNAPEKDA